MLKEQLSAALYSNKLDAVVSASSQVTGTPSLIIRNTGAAKRVLVQNLGNKAIYLGPPGVSAASGFRLAAGCKHELNLGAPIEVHAVADFGTQDVRCLQLS